MYKYVRSEEQLLGFARRAGIIGWCLVFVGSLAAFLGFHTGDAVWLSGVAVQLAAGILRTKFPKFPESAPPLPV